MPSFDASDEEIVNAANARRAQYGRCRVVYVALSGGMSEHAPAFAVVDYSEAGRPTVTRESYAQRYPNLCTPE